MTLGSGLSALCLIMSIATCLGQNLLHEVDDYYRRSIKFVAQPGKRLLVPISGANTSNETVTQKSLLANDIIDCTFECLAEKWCHSLNVKLTLTKSGQHVCELIVTDKYNHSEYLVQDNDSVHLGIKTCIGLLAREKHSNIFANLNLALWVVSSKESLQPSDVVVKGIDRLRDQIVKRSNYPKAQGRLKTLSQERGYPPPKALNLRGRESHLQKSVERARIPKAQNQDQQPSNTEDQASSDSVEEVMEIQPTSSLVGGIQNGDELIDDDFVTKSDLKSELKKIWTKFNVLESPISELTRKIQLLEDENSKLKATSTNVRLDSRTNSSSSKRQKKTNLPKSGENDVEIIDRSLVRDDGQQQAQKPEPVIIIVEDSMIKDIDGNKLSRKQVVKRVYRGKTAENIEGEMCNISIPEGTLASHVIIHAGTNNLPTDSPETCANKLASLANKAKQCFPDAKVAVSSLT
ncbi:predicted protein [Nematostella vectensis]|uniref:Macro domain-containing protein n=1 Tax=Nematostella vectensis TaxID=45351 RepID=A7S2V2_NEMVE|nr:predicted protein [Nematostella vectensis]|eukprot:XP_001634056.1 predicted protein [Nematostella vectensis]